MESKINVYVVLTEYQFLQSVNIATGKFNSKNYTNIIYVVRNGSRLIGIDASKKWTLDNGQIHILDNKKPKEIAQIILNETPNHFFIFQGNSPLNVFLASSFSKRGADISLGPDGYGAYNVFNKKYPLLTLAKDTFKGNYFLLKNKLFNGAIHRFDYYKYANHKFIDYVWVPHPKQYIHQAKNEVKVLKLPELNKECIEFIENCFDFNECYLKQDVIYYFNQPLWAELEETELKFLHGVLDTFPDKEVIIKLHPLTSKVMKDKYLNVNRVKIIDSLVPAEVILISLKNCIVFSGWSSVLMLENSSCNYYFNYPIYKNSNVKMLNQSDLIVLNHINLVDKPNLMRFPNE